MLDAAVDIAVGTLSWRPIFVAALLFGIIAWMKASRWIVVALSVVVAVGYVFTMTKGEAYGELSPDSVQVAKLIAAVAFAIAVIAYNEVIANAFSAFRKSAKAKVAPKRKAVPTKR